MLNVKILHIKHITRLLTVISLLLAVNNNVFNQEDCLSSLQEAQKYYDMGMIEDVPRMLSTCMEEGFSRAQKIEAYKLIILSYLFDDNQFEAEKTMLEFLKKFPEYEIMPNDPVEFVYLFESYRTTSVFSVGISVGFNLTDPRVIEPYSVFDLNGADLKNTMRPGFQLGLGFSRYVTKEIQVGIELYFSSANYKFTDELRTTLYDGPNAVNKVTYTEKLYKLELPITATYEFTIKKTHYYARAGLSLARVTGVTGQPSLIYSEESPPSTGENFNMASYRRKMLFSGIIGAGMQYKVPRGVVVLDIRANLGVNNIVRSDKRYENQSVTDKYFYLDDDFSLNTLSLSASYYFSFYKPKKQR